MTEKKDFKPDKEIISKIQSDDENTNLAVIELMRTSGRKEYIPYLIDLAGSTNYETVYSEVFKLLDELKSKDSVVPLISAIQNNKYKKIRKKLVESCWQNGLNYSQHLSVFTELLLYETDEISFEAFTVIENMEYMPQDSILKEEIEKLKSHLTGKDSPRQYFIKETISILNQVLNQKD
ncbi:MAG: hypothetical protein JXR31_05910 [Prolixibacteraceae bacterium]|nr:hypothetical protein [Prolixibacteraceae bacterium]